MKEDYKNRGFDGTDSEVLSMDAAFLHNCIREMSNLTSKGGPPAKVLAVTERGGKARIVTKSPGALVTLGNWVLKPVLDILRKIPETKQVLFGDREKSINDLFNMDQPENERIRR